MDVPSTKPSVDATRFGLANGRTRLNPLAVRFTPEEAEWIDAYCLAAGCAKAEAVRALLRMGHAAMDPNGLSIPAALHSIQARLTDVSSALDELTTFADQLNDTYGKVWVETLMGTRLLLDAQSRGLIERVKEMTTRYLERIAKQ